MKLSASRVVAFIVTPVLSILAGGAAAVGAKYGLHVNQTAFTADGLGIAGATATAALKWLHGNSEFEREYESLKTYWAKHGSEVEADEKEAVTGVDTVAPGIVQDIEGQADKVVEAAKSKLVAILTPTPEGTVVAAPVAPVTPTPATPVPEAAA